MGFKSFFAAVFLTVIMAFPSLAQDTVISKDEVLTLDKCIEIALKNNPNITKAANTAEVYRSKIGQAKSGLFPEVNLSSGYSRQNPKTNSGNDKSSNSYSGSVALEQLIFDFGKTPSAIKIQKLNFDSSQMDLQNEIINTAYLVKLAYYNALSSKIGMDIYNQSIEQYKQHLNQARAFFKAGTKSKIDVTSAEVNLSNAQLNYIKAVNAYKTALTSLNNAMGIPDAPEYSLIGTVEYNSNKKTDDNKKISQKLSAEKFNITDNLVFKKYDITFEDALNSAYKNRPDLKSVDIRTKSAKESVKTAKKDYLPVLSGFANYGFGGQEFPLDAGWAFGANASLPIFNGFLTKNKINEAKANLEVSKSNIDILRQNIHLQVQQAYINLTEAEKRIPISEISVKQAKENLELAIGRYNVGVGNSIEVRDAEINYDNAQLSYVQVFYDYNTARTNLEKAMGVQ